MDDDDDFFWCKNGRPAVEKDRVKNALASYCLSHLKTDAIVMKTIHADPRAVRFPDRHDLFPFIGYSLNKKRRWETCERLDVDVLDSLRKANDVGWRVLVLERVNLRSYVWSCWDYGSAPERFTDLFMVRSVREFTEHDGFRVTELDSIFGQRYSHFEAENRMPSKREPGELEELEEQEPIAAYNVLRAPSNYLPLLQKKYQSSNFGWEWPHSAFWRRVERFEDMLLELRYGEIEDPDAPEIEDVDQEEEDVNVIEKPSEFYNLEDHLVDKFVFVKNRHRRRRRRTKTFDQC